MSNEIYYLITIIAFWIWIWIINKRIDNANSRVTIYTEMVEFLIEESYRSNHATGIQRMAQNTKME
jgi:hypothetical protein